MFQFLRQCLTILLMAFLPFHAFLVTFGTKLMLGANNAPLTALSLWKEGILGIILGIACIEIFQKRRSLLRVDLLDMLILSLIILSFLLFFFHFPLSPSDPARAGTFHFLLGFKYDFVPLIAFLLLRRVSWSTDFQEVVQKLLLVLGGVIAILGFVSLFASSAIFTFFGYSDLHSLYVPGGPLAAFQQIESLGIHRMQSTMSGPNQLGMWLLLPWSIALVRRRYTIAVIIFVAILLTFSRAAWIASGIIFIMVLWRSVPRKLFFRALGGVFVASFLAAVVLYSYAPGIIARSVSTQNHIDRPLEAMRMIKAHPFGLGLGSAGPASNRVSDACVHLPEGADVTWAQDRQNLCVFRGDVQVQPVDRVCQCPILPENWYLQIGVEMGLLGMVLFIAFVILMILRSPKGSTAILPFIGVSVAALFLHAWEDSAVSLSIMILLAVSFSALRRE